MRLRYLFSFFVFIFMAKAIGSTEFDIQREVLLVKDASGGEFQQWNDSSLRVHVEVELIVPKKNQKPVAVMVIPGSGGGLPTEKAMEFAKLGYPALAVKYFDYKPQSQFNFSITQLPLETFVTAAKYLENCSLNIEKIVLHGRSRGGEAALLVGSYFPRLFDGIIAEVPSSHSWGDRANGIWSQYFLSQPDSAKELSSWTVGGNPVPFVKMKGWLQTFSGESRFEGLPLFRYRDAYEFSLKTASFYLKSRARIKVERIKAPLLLTGGGDDQIWPSDVSTRKVRLARRLSGKAIRDKYIIDKKAGHIWGPEFVEPLKFPSGVYDFAKEDFSNICEEDDLSQFLEDIKPLTLIKPTRPAIKNGYPYEGHKEEIKSICENKGSNLNYYFAPEYALQGGTAQRNERLGKKTWMEIKKFLKRR